MKIFGFEIFGNGRQKNSRPQASYTGNNTNYNNSFRSDGSKWRGGLTGRHSHMTYNHWQLRNQARNAYQDSVHAHGLIHRHADAVADVGMTFDSNPNYKILGITPERAEDWARDVEERFNLWAKDVNASRSRTMSFYQAQRLYQISDKRDGENFIRLYYSKATDLLNPLQFELIDPNQIRGDANTSTLGPYAQDDGIIRNADGSEKAYKIWLSKYSNNRYSMEYVIIPKIGEKSKRRLMCHAYIPEYAGQGRGFSPLSHALQEFQNMTDFTQAQIKKAINQSNLVMFAMNKQQDPSNPIGDEAITPPSYSGLGVSAEDTCDPTGEGEACDDILQYNNALNEANLDVPGSKAFFNLIRGDEIKAFENTAPSESFESFVNAFVSSLVSSTGMSPEYMFMKFNSSYSAARGSLLIFWRSVLIFRANMEAGFLSPILEAWLDGEIAAGRITAPGWNDTVLRKAWMSGKWIGSPMPNIDPMRTAGAVEKYLNMNLTTAEREARNYDGSDIKANIVKNQKTYSEMARPYWQE